MNLNFNDFKDQAAKILNLNLDGYKINRVQRRTKSFMKQKRVTCYKEFLNKLNHDETFKNQYLDYFTINTSEFFRNPEKFQYLKENILPQLFENNDFVKIWSAPCSIGAEPYSIAIILDELNIKNNRYKILASDIDSTILTTAKKGIFDIRSLEKISEKRINKYFSKHQDNKIIYEINPDIRNNVEFKKMDLIKEPYHPGWNLILNRNFFIYLTSELKEKLTYKFSSALKKNGFFFLGSTEFLFNPEKFGLEKIHFSFYQKSK